MLTADRGTAPSRGNEVFLQAGIGRTHGCVGGGSQLYGQTSVCIKSVPLQDEIQSHGTDREKMKASGPENRKIVERDFPDDLSSG